MSASDTYDRYVTYGIFVPDGQTASMPVLDPWSLPVWWPSWDDFFPKDVDPTYAIRNTSGDVTVQAPDGTPVSVTSPGWWLYFYGQYQYIEDAYFSGGIPDTSFGSQYPPEGMRDYVVVPPQWVLDGTDPTPPPSDPGTGTDWQQQPDPGGGGMSTPDDPTGGADTPSQPDPPLDGSTTGTQAPTAPDATTEETA